MSDPQFLTPVINDFNVATQDCRNDFNVAISTNAVNAADPEAFTHQLSLKLMLVARISRRIQDTNGRLIVADGERYTTYC